MFIENVVVGDLETNCYILFGNKSNNCFIIDPGDDFDIIDRKIMELKLNPIAIINTHGHADHIGANSYFKHKYKLKIYIHKDDAHCLPDPNSNLSTFFVDKIISPPADITLLDNDIIILDDIELNILHTPGHTQGSICIYIKKGNILFSGDTLFLLSVGRTDLPGGSEKTLIESLNRLKQLPLNTKVLPGHGEATTIEYEIKNNPYLINSLGYI